MKRIFKKILTLVMVIITIFCSFTTIAYAAVSVISNVTTKEIAEVDDVEFVEGVQYYNIGGLATGKGKNSMFVMKATDDEQFAAFYYYPDIDNPSKYGVYRLRHAGHANAMAIDNNNVYVAGWAKDNNGVGYQGNNKYNNWILMIPRPTIAAMGLTKTGKHLPKDDKSTEAVEGFTVLYPKVKKVASDGTVTYSDFKKPITNISKYKTNGSFLIQIDISGISGDFEFTKAKLETYNGKTLFVVSEDPNDMFIIEDNVQDTLSVSQDICYSPNCGLFIPRWYGNSKSEYYNPNKNVIAWADIDGDDYTLVTASNGKKYKKFTPIKINVNKSNEKVDGIKKYSMFEIESIAFTLDDTLLFSCNVQYTADYAKANNIEDKDKDNKYEADAIFKLTYDGNKKFVLSNIQS